MPQAFDEKAPLALTRTLSGPSSVASQNLRDPLCAAKIDINLTVGPNAALRTVALKGTSHSRAQ